MPRPSLFLVLAVLLASCTEEAGQTCAGESVGTFAFTGELNEDLDPVFDPDPALTDCSDAMRFPDQLPAFGGTFAVAGGTAGALCRADGLILFGTRAGNHWVVENTADGAVLGGCDPTCAARSRVVISGDVLADPTSRFEGGLVEQLTYTGGECGACSLPCAARYALTGTQEEP